MNIKSQEAYDIASEIAGWTGESMTHVVLEALRGHRRAVRRARNIEGTLALLREMREQSRPEVLSFDIDKELYDPETGLPA